MVFIIARKFFNMPGNFKMSEVKIFPSHDMLRFFILQAIAMIGAHRYIVVLLKISVFVYIFFVPAGHLSGTISCAAPSPKCWVDPSWDRPSQNRAWAPPNFGTFSCARPLESICRGWGACLYLNRLINGLDISPLLHDPDKIICLRLSILT